MRVIRLVSKIARICIYVVLAVLLFAAGLLLTLYSQWGQDLIKDRLLAKLNETPGFSLQIDDFRLRFPVKLDVSGVSLVQQGDTMLLADSLHADVKLLPLFAGRVSVDDLRLVNGFYQMGNADSLMWMRVRAAVADLHPASVNLANMGITLDDGLLKGATVDLVLRPDTAAADTTPPEKQDMRIKIRKLRIDDLTYRMSMLPTIDSLGVNIGSGMLRDGLIDLGKQRISLHTLDTDSLRAAYIAPDSATVAAYPAPPADDTAASEPWTVTIDTISMVRSEALYTTRGTTPLPGLDFAYISATGMALKITDFYNQASTIRLPIELHATERCGVQLDAYGTFSTDSTMMRFSEFNISTPDSYINADGYMGIGDMTADPRLPMQLKAKGYLGMPDLKLMFPAFKPYLALVPAPEANIDIDVAGTPAQLGINTLSLGLPGCLGLSGKGSLQNIFDTDNLGADIRLKGNIFNVKNLVKAFTTPDMHLLVPPMALDGEVKMHGGVTDGSLTATTLGGRIALDASYNAGKEGYTIDLTTDDFPVQAFMPDLGVGRATLDLRVDGRGFDMFSPATDIDCVAQIASIEYLGYDYRHISLDAGLHKGSADLSANMHTDDAYLMVEASGNLDGDLYEWRAYLHTDIPDLQTLKLTEMPMAVATSLRANASYAPKTGGLTADIFLPELSYSDSENLQFTITDIDAKLQADSTSTSIALHNHDLTANATVMLPIDMIGVRMDSVMSILDRQIAIRKIDVDTLQRELPAFDIAVNAGADNMINDILRAQGMNIGHLALAASNDSVISLASSLYGLDSGSALLDTIRVDMTQRNDKMHLTASLDNRQGNMPEFAHVTADGLLYSDRVSLRLIQQNAQRQTGFDLGFIASLADSTVSARLFPLSPVIGYKKWSVNFDNVVRYNLATHNIDANLKMKGDDSSLQLTTDRSTQNDSINNIVLSINDIHLSDWLTINPFAPQISGDLSAVMNLQWDGAANINGNGTVSMTEFYYDRRKVSDMDLNFDVTTSLSGSVRANADLVMDNVRTLSVSGVLNDTVTATPFDLDLEVIEFPLETVNPFIPEDVAQLHGYLNGDMCISGDASNPLLNGSLDFESAYVKVAMTNTSYKFSDVKIPVKDNIVAFNNFNITGANENPLAVNGTVDLRSLSSPKVDLSFKATNMMLVNTQKATRNAVVYGKAYVNLDANVTGNMRFMRANANLTVLSGTNVNYIMTDAATEFTAAENDGMVKFVNLADSTAVVVADSIANTDMLLMLEAQLTIQNGTTVTVDLPTGSRDKVQIQPSGYLNYSMAPMSDGRMTGRIDLNNGFVRYSLPVVGSEKYFTFDPNSYVLFNGDMLNPVLNIMANDEVKANVNADGQNSRLVNFDIGVAITGTLDKMDVVFDLSTDDDLTVANELQSMSAEQRANQAMNMLLYNMYTGPGTTGNANLSGNPLFSFLESQINNWAANNIKGVDLSFGIDQYNQTTNGMTTSTMSYSYQVSKTLFNDRFKIVVGGNYTTDTNVDENLAENLINDISLEYYLNDQHTMLLRIFRHVGYESILEGEVTQTGVGFVYRRKLNRLIMLLPKFMRPRPKHLIQARNESKP